MKFSIDEILYSDIKICQPLKGFRFGIDSIILAWFATVKKKERIVDIGSGSGIISVLLARLKKAEEITAVELQNQMFGCLENTIELNNLSKNIIPVHSDIRHYNPPYLFHMAVCNPPYRPAGKGRKPALTSKETACIDNSLNLEEILSFCKKHIYYGGRLAFAGDADQLATAISCCRNYTFEPKRLMFMHSAIGKKAKLFFLECVYGSGAELIVEPPVIQDEASCNDIYSNILHGRWN